jgi:YtcA-like protein
MRDTRKDRIVMWELLLSLSTLPLASCSRAPSVDILGSFFPSWLVCTTLAVLLTVLTRWVLLRFHMSLDLAVPAYPSLAALFTFALWLIFFH